jgi:hypothetical protein
MCVALHDVVKSSDQYQHQYAELMEAFTKIPGFQIAVSQWGKEKEQGKSDGGFQLPPLSHQSSHLSSTPTDQPPSKPGYSRTPTDHLTGPSTPTATTTPAAVSHDVLEYMGALDNLVSLRFAIAFMQGRKLNPGLIRHR